MSDTIQMPALGESVTEGTITRWLKHVGDHVELDEPLLEVSTDKVDTEIPSPQKGVLQQIVAREDETIEVGGDLAIIGGEPAPAESDSDSSDATAQPETSAPAPASESTPEPEPSSSRGGAASGAEDERRHENPTPLAPDSATEATPPSSVPQSDSLYATPLVRKLATERGVDLSAITGTGAGGRIRKQDVVKAVDEHNQQRKTAAASSAAPDSTDTALAPEQPATAPADGSSQAVHDGIVSSPAGTASPTPQPEESGLGGTTQRISRRRATIAKRMVESLQTSAQLTTVVEADLTRIARLRDRAKADFQRREGVNLSFLPFMALATVEALKAHPLLNASIDTEQSAITYHDAEHLGIAVDSPSGLLVPVIRNAGDLNLGGLARKIADVAERTQANTIAPDELSGGTFTITNTGSRGALIDTPIINQPEVGILGTGAVVKKPSVVADGEGGESIAIRSKAYLCLSYDHRLVDGADAARFLNTVKTRLEAGTFETELGL